MVPKGDVSLQSPFNEKIAVTANKHAHVSQVRCFRKAIYNQCGAIKSKSAIQLKPFRCIHYVTQYKDNSEASNSVLNAQKGIIMPGALPFPFLSHYFDNLPVTGMHLPGDFAMSSLDTPEFPWQLKYMSPLLC